MSDRIELAVQGAVSITHAVIRRCRELGFALAGVCRADVTSHERELREWLAAGAHGDMSWMAERIELRADPGAMLPGAKSIIVVADRYADATPDTPAPGRGRVARYARGDDYHTLMKRRLITLADELAAAWPDHRFRAAVDTAPVLEREHAARAGLGYIGKNTMLIEPGVGSYLLLGEILSTLGLDPNPRRYEDHCGTCTRCIDACPTGAIEPWRVDARKCISYLTIEHRTLIDEAHHERTGDWIFGCDICQEVCPHSGDTPATRAAPRHPAYEARNTTFDLLDILGWTEGDRRAAFIKSAMKRAKLDMMKRNALIAAGNDESLRNQPEFRRRLAALVSDEAESELVRETALRVRRRLDSESGSSLARHPPARG